jgi:hypothetical protein
MSALAQARFAVGLDRRQGLLVREALAQRPYHEVEELIARLDAWAGRVFGPGGDGAPLALRYADLALVVQALADLPYRRVHALIGSLERQIAALPGFDAVGACEAA